MPNKGNFFKDRREELDLTQRDIALALGVTDSAVSSWELDQCPPRLKLSAKLAEVYRVSEARIIREIVELSKSISAAKGSHHEIRKNNLTPARGRKEWK